MNGSEPHSVTILLERLSAGDHAAEAELLALVYSELRNIAAANLVRLGPGQTLQATALVNEAYLKLATGRMKWDGRAHFFGAAARAMRNIIVDQVRRKATTKHGGGRRQIELDVQIAGAPATDTDRVLDIAEALARLEEDQPRAARVVDLRFFVGLSDEEAAEAMEISVRTVYREWSYAKAWLRRELANSCILD